MIEPVEVFAARLLAIPEDGGIYVDRATAFRAMIEERDRLVTAETIEICERRAHWGTDY